MLGTSTPASAAVLATYFGGLTLGAWLYGRRTRAPGSPARAWKVYGFLEGFIATGCLALALAFDRLVPAFVPLLQFGVGHPALLTIARLVVAACWILPVTIPMGATFPAVVDGLDVLSPSRREKAVSVFYAMNLLGAIAAAGAGPWLVFPRLGVDRALLLASLLDATAAIVALELAASSRSTRVTEAMRGEELAPPARMTLPVLVSALSGFVLFSLEVTWTHLIGTVIGSSVYAFATMLTVTLTALGCGAFISGVIASRFVRVPSWVPGLALALGSVILSLTHSRWPEAPHALADAGLTVGNFGDAERARAGVAVKLLFPPAFILGTVYPLLLRLDAFPRSSGGRVAARMGAVNALGSIAGAVLTGFVFIPTIGAEQTLRVLSAMCVVAGAVIVGAFGTPRRMRWAALPLTVIGVIGIAFVKPWDRLHLTSGEQVYLERHHVWDGSRLRFFHEDTLGGFTTVVENSIPDGKFRVLLTNGKFQGNDGGEMTAQDGFALLPMMFVEHWADALVIGLGTGRSVNVVQSMGFDRVVAAELAPGIVEAARTEFAHINGGVLDKPNVELALTDARNHLLLSDRPYDLISMEISSVWIAGATNLYSSEFYHLCKSRLAKGGAIQQWVQLHHISIDDIGTVMASMHDAFPYVSLFVTGGQGILVGTNEPQRTRGELFARLAAHGGELGADAKLLVEHLHSVRLLDPNAIEAFLAARRPTLNTDKNRLLEYTTPTHALDRTRVAANLKELSSYSSFRPQEVDANVDHELATAARALDSENVRRALDLP